MDLRVHRIPFSTNVERIAIAAAHKGLTVTWVDHDPADRSALRALSGQELVPVAELPGGEVVADSPAILARLEELVPDPPLWPRDPARRAEADIVLAWFNRVWKIAPNALEALRAQDARDPAQEAALAAELRATLPWFEALLADRPFLLGDELGIADVTAYPFLRYARRHDPADREPFHLVLIEELALGDAFPRIAGWIDRLDELPRA